MPVGGAPGGVPPGTLPPRDKGATRSLVLAIIGLLFCPVIFSVGAIYEGHQSRKRIREAQGALGGDGLAQAGFILGIIGLCLIPVWGVLIFAGE